jgi:hypothetical protein
MRLNLFFLLIISSAITNAQWKKDYSLKVEEFMVIVESYYNELEFNKSNIQRISDSELDHFANKMYGAIAEDPVGYEKYIIKKHKEWDRKIKEKKIDTTTTRFGYVIELIENQLSNKYSREFVSLIKIPYFLRIKIKSKSHKIIQDVIPLKQTAFLGEIEEVVKGNLKFKKGEQISFSYLNLNRAIENCENDFEIGKSYFVPLVITTFDNKEYNDLVVKHLSEFVCSTYIIDNEQIKIPDDYFNISNESNWQEFKQSFKQKYIVEKNREKLR